MKIEIALGEPESETKEAYEALFADEDKVLEVKCRTGIHGVEFATSLVDGNTGWTPLKTGKSGYNKSDRKRNRKNRWR